MGGSKDGDGKGEKAYGVTGMTDGPGSVSTPWLLLVRSTEEGGGELLLLPEDDKLAGPDVDVVEGNDDCGERVDTERDKGVDGEDDDDDGNVGVAEARAAARRTRMAVDRMTVGPVDYCTWGGRGKVARLSQPGQQRGEIGRKDLYGSAISG
jgi:hypothetical protein